MEPLEKKGRKKHLLIQNRRRVLLSAPILSSANENYTCVWVGGIFVPQKIDF